MVKDKDEFLWDFSALPDFAGIESNSIRLVNTAPQIIQRIQGVKGQIATLEPVMLGQYLTAYEELLSVTDQLKKGSQLRLFQNRTPQTEEEYVAAVMFSDFVTSQTDFIKEEIAALPDDKLAILSDHPATKRFAAFARNTKYSFRPLENTQLELDRVRVVEDLKKYGEKIDDSELAQKLSSDNQEERKIAAEKRGKLLKENAAHIATYFDKAIGLSEKIAKEKGYSSAKEMATNEDGLAPQILDALSQTAIERAGDGHHKYMEFKRKIIAPDSSKLATSDIFAPTGKTPEYSLAEATKVTQDLYVGFDKEMGAEASRIFAEKRIDTRYFPQGKEACPQVVEMAGGKPFVLTHFGGAYEDLSNMMHEVGHAIHYTLAKKNPSILYGKAYTMPVPMIEIFALFSERLLTDKIGKNNNEIKAAYLENRKWFHDEAVAYTMFEEKLHNLKKSGKTLDAETISDCWVESMQKIYGDKVQIDDTLRYAWASPQLSHYFTETPFYAYSYAFASRISDIMFEQYKQSPALFVEQYKVFQRAGQELPLFEALQKHFNINVQNKETWQVAENIYSAQIAELTENKAQKPAIGRFTSKATEKPREISAEQAIA